MESANSSPIQTLVIKTRRQSSDQRFVHVVQNSRWRIPLRRRRRRGKFKFLTCFESKDRQTIHFFLHRRLCDMDADAFMMHEFDSDLYVYL